MNDQWNLDALYPSFESEAFQQAWVQGDRLMEEYQQFARSFKERGCVDVEALESYLKLEHRMMKIFEPLFTYCSLVLSVDATHELALKYSDQLSFKWTQLAEAGTAVIHLIGSVEDLEGLIRQSAFLKEHRFFLLELKESKQYMLSEREESLVAKYTYTGSNAWSDLRDTIIAKLKVVVETEGGTLTLPLAEATNLLSDSDPKMREAAFNGLNQAYRQVEDSLSACLNAIKGEYLTGVELRGYESPLQATLKQARMKEETLNAMLEVMKAYLPKFQQYLKTKARLLGHEEGLPWWDLFAPIGESQMEYPYEAGCEFVLQQFKTFSDHLADYAKRAMTEQWIDVYPREGKTNGAFCASIGTLKQSRILLNYGNQFDDVVTLAHELGHGFHNECLKEESVLNTDYPMPLAETASTFCETVVKKAAIQAASPEEAFAILEADLMDTTQIIVDIYSRFLFESRYFEARQQGTLTPEETCELMMAAQKEAYGDALDSNTLYPYAWAGKSHYFDSHFYNFPYAFGLLFAKGLYAQYLEQGESFVPRYEKLLAMTGKATVEEVAQWAGIDVTDVAFWNQALAMIEDDLIAFEQLAKERLAL